MPATLGTLVKVHWGWRRKNKVLSPLWDKNKEQFCAQTMAYPPNKKNRTIKKSYL